MNLLGIKEAPVLHLTGEVLTDLDHPVMSPDGRALWDWSDGYFWVLLEPDGEHLYVSLDAEGPVPSWMEYLHDVGLTDTMFPDARCGDEFMKALLELGVCPGQRVFIHMTFSARWDNYTNEGWDETDWRLLDKENLSPAQELDAWEKWLDFWCEGSNDWRVA
jgi:hypothetical protein